MGGGGTVAARVAEQLAEGQLDGVSRAGGSTHAKERRQQDDGGSDDPHADPLFHSLLSHGVLL